MEIKSNFMSDSMRKKAATANKPGNQFSAAGTTRRHVTLGARFRRGRYLAAMALLLLSNGFSAAEDARLAEVKLPVHFDPFAVDAKDQYEAAARAACSAAKPALFVGYRWRLPAVAAELRQMTGESPGKQLYIAFLKSKYGYRIADVNADYGTDAQSFTELLESPMTRGVAMDDAEFDAPPRREMFEAITGALRKCDPRHAEGGIRLILQALLATF